MNAHLAFMQGSVNATYLMHLHSLFQTYCGSPPRESTYVHSQTGETHGYIRFTTLSSPIFNEFLELFYPNGSKVVPQTIGTILTPRSLAYWAMDDGVKVGPGFTLCTF